MIVDALLKRESYLRELKRFLKKRRRYFRYRRPLLARNATRIFKAARRPSLARAKAFAELVKILPATRAEKENVSKQFEESAKLRSSKAELEKSKGLEIANCLVLEIGRIYRREIERPFHAGLVAGKASPWLQNLMNHKIRKLKKAREANPFDIMKLFLVPKGSSNKPITRSEKVGEAFRAGTAGYRLLVRLTAGDILLERVLFSELNKALDEHFSPNLLSFRRFSLKAGLGRAATRIMDFRKSSNVFFTVDMKGYYDNIDHRTLLSECADLFRSALPQDSAALLQIVESFLIRYDRTLQEYGISSRRKGIPQGSPLSNLLSNIYLMKLDKMLDEEKLFFVRYVDDIIVGADRKRNVDSIRDSVESITRQLYLESEKSSTFPSNDEFTFLRKRYPRVSGGFFGKLFGG